VANPIECLRQLRCCRRASPGFVLRKSCGQRFTAVGAPMGDGDVQDSTHAAQLWDLRWYRQNMKLTKSDTLEL
jgi:hypothetical protein